MPGQAQPVAGGSRIFSATYSNVPVYEYSIDGDQIMRRRADDYINATHILKSAGYDKPARTRILEREIQKGVHEKVQGGYGKYQGTWIPHHDARALAEKNGVMEKLRPIFDYVPGDRSPPPAPKHTTAQSSKPRAPRQSNPPARRPADHSRMSDAPYNAYVPRETPEHMSVRSGSPYDYPGSRYSASQSRKRKRDVNEPPRMTIEEEEHTLWTNELLDYFIVQNDIENAMEYPDPPPSVNLDRGIDDKGHTAMHWAAAMGDIVVVRDLLQRGARMNSTSENGETPLMRAVMFTNNHDKHSMDQLFRSLVNTSSMKDNYGSTVFHHLVQTTSSKTKYPCARYYLEIILDRMKATYRSGDIVALLNQQDNAGDTAVLIAAKFGARKCVRILLANGASNDIPNLAGETAEAYIEKLNARRRERYSTNLDSGVPSSSPPRDFGSSVGLGALGELDGASRTPSKRVRTSYRSEAATLLSSQLPTLIESRTQALAAEFERDLAEQEASVTEGVKALEVRREEVERLRKEYESASAAAMDGRGNDNDSATADLNALEEEVSSLLESERLSELEHIMQDDTHASSTLNGMPTQDDQKALAKEVLDLQSRRRQLLDELNAAISLTGTNGLNLLDGQYSKIRPIAESKQISKYLALIRHAMHIPPDEEVDIETLLPEILQQLEEEKREPEEVAQVNGAIDVDDMMQIDGLTPTGPAHRQGKGYTATGYGFGAISNERDGMDILS